MAKYFYDTDVLLCCGSLWYSLFTHRGRNKMTVILQAICVNAFWFGNYSFTFFIQISRKFVPSDRLNNKAPLVEIIAWWGIGDKLVSEAITILFTDAYARHSASTSHKLFDQTSTRCAWQKSQRRSHFNLKQKWLSGKFYSVPLFYRRSCDFF